LAGGPWIDAAGSSHADALAKASGGVKAAGIGAARPRGL